MSSLPRTHSQETVSLWRSLLLPCRAFFRRHTQQEDLPECRAGGRCNITSKVRKHCQACRYDKCLRNGMRPELILNEVEKKRRFKKFWRKKVEGDSNVRSSRGPQYSNDESLNERALEMPLREPTERHPKSPTHYSEVISFPHPFPVSTSSTHCQPTNICCNLLSYFASISLHKSFHDPRTITSGRKVCVGGWWWWFRR